MIGSWHLSHSPSSFVSRCEQSPTSPPLDELPVEESPVDESFTDESGALLDELPIDESPVEESGKLLDELPVDESFADESGELIELSCSLDAPPIMLDEMLDELEDTSELATLDDSPDAPQEASVNAKQIHKRFLSFFTTIILHYKIFTLPL